MPEEPESRADQTRQRILAAALDLFQEHGFHGTSMRQIAGRAGVALGSIYNHFPAKDDIFLAVLQANHPYHEVFQSLRAAGDEPFETFIRRAANSMLAALERRPYFINLMLIEIVEFKSTHMPTLFQQAFPELITLVQNFADRQPELKPIPLPVIFRAFIGLFFSYYVSGAILVAELPFDFGENALDHFVDIFLHGVMSEG
ncbi:MAG TPA: TetR/AcrR family transcriptional regulator [Anaerolineales bacterium]